MAKNAGDVRPRGAQNWAKLGSRNPNSVSPNSAMFLGGTRFRLGARISDARSDPLQRPPEAGRQSLFVGGCSARLTNSRPITAEAGFAPARGPMFAKIRARRGQCAVAWAMRDHFRAISQAHPKLTPARVGLTIKVDQDWSNVQLTSSAPPLNISDRELVGNRRKLRRTERGRLADSLATEQLSTYEARVWNRSGTGVGPRLDFLATLLALGLTAIRTSPARSVSGLRNQLQLQMADIRSRPPARPQHLRPWPS